MMIFLVASFLASFLFIFAVPGVAMMRAFKNLKSEGFGSLLNESEQVLDSKDNFKSFGFFILSIVIAVLSSISTIVLTFVSIIIAIT